MGSKRKKKMKPDLATLTPLAEFRPEQGSEAEFISLLEKSSSFARCQSWVESVIQTLVAHFFPSIFLIVLIESRKNYVSENEWAWVIVGDLPPAYINDSTCNTPYDALDAYIGEMDEWVAATSSGQSVEHLKPVNAKSSPDYADRLKTRLDFINSKILPAVR